MLCALVRNPLRLSSELGNNKEQKRRAVRRKTSENTRDKAKQRGVQRQKKEERGYREERAVEEECRCRIKSIEETEHEEQQRSLDAE